MGRRAGAHEDLLNVAEACSTYQDILNIRHIRFSLGSSWKTVMRLILTSAPREQKNNLLQICSSCSYSCHPSVFLLLITAENTRFLFKEYLQNVAMKVWLTDDMEEIASITSQTGLLRRNCFSFSLILFSYLYINKPTRHVKDWAQSVTQPLKWHFNMRCFFLHSLQNLIPLQWANSQSLQSKLSQIWLKCKI